VAEEAVGAVTELGVAAVAEEFFMANITSVPEPIL
jgi:hypothetical protein